MLNPQTQKITAYIPIDLLHEAQAITGKGITETLKIALAGLARAKAYDDLRSMRGKVNISINLNELRRDENDSR